MKTLSELLKTKRGQLSQRPTFFEMDEVFSRKIGDPLLKKLDYRLT